MSDEVECARHGSTLPAFVCRHLVRGIACGFWVASPQDDQSRPDATCDRCNERMTAGKELKSKDIALVCGYCWDDARTRNENVPLMARGTKARLTAKEQRNLIHHAVHEIQATQERAQARWGVGLGSNAPSYMKWQFDGDKTLTFFDDGTPVVVGEVQMVGSHSTKSGTFQWSWETYGDPDHPLTSKVSDLEGFGQVRGIKRLTTPSWTCDEQEGWEMTALAGYLVGCEAIYRAPFSSSVHWFMLLSGMRFVS